MARSGKKYQEAVKLLDKTKAYSPQEAIELAKKTARARFDETVELHLRVGIDPRDSSQQVRGVALLPHGLGKKVRVLVFAQGEAARIAEVTGADFVGMVFAPSRRQVSLEKARLLIGAVHRLEPRPALVGVFVNLEAKEVNHIAESCQLDWVQLSGDETWQYCREIRKPVIKVIHVSSGQKAEEILAEVETGHRVLVGKEFVCLLDSAVKEAHGGTGQVFDWRLAREVVARFPAMIAGGLTLENVAQLLAEVRPWGLDVSSGVETKGRKDIGKITAFIQAVRQADGVTKTLS